MLIISGRLASEPVLKKVIVHGKKKFVLNNCVFVNTTNKVKKSVPVNITAWDRNATYIAENFEKGEKINLVGIEKLDSIRIDNKTYGVCTFTVIKVIDWKIYKAINGILTALITRIINCSDVIAENILSPELLQINDRQETDQETEKENEDDVANDEHNLISKSLDDNPGEDPVEESFDNDNNETPAGEINDCHDNVNSIDLSEDFEDTSSEEDPEDDFIPSREPSGYYILDFSYIKKENYHS